MASKDHSVSRRLFLVGSITALPTIAAGAPRNWRHAKWVSTGTLGDNGRVCRQDGATFELNDSALELWRSCKSGACGDALVAALTRLGATAEQAEQDALVFLRAMSHHGLVVVGQ